MSGRARRRVFQANNAVSRRNEGGGDWLLYNPDSDECAVLNATAEVLWSALAEPRSIEDLARCLTSRFQGVSEERARLDAEAFVEALSPLFLNELSAGVAPDAR